MAITKIVATISTFDYSSPPYCIVAIFLKSIITCLEVRLETSIIIKTNKLLSRIIMSSVCTCFQDLINTCIKVITWEGGGGG